MKRRSRKESTIEPMLIERTYVLWHKIRPCIPCGIACNAVPAETMQHRRCFCPFPPSMAYLQASALWFLCICQLGFKCVTRLSTRPFTRGGITFGDFAHRAGENGAWLLPHGCGPGQTGPMCQSCSDGFARSGTTGYGQCRPCASANEVQLRQSVLSVVSVALTQVLIYCTLATGQRSGSTVAIHSILVAQYS